MLLRYYGHDLFTLTLDNGTVIATDPYSALYNYPERSLAADICTVSHHHGDHDSVHILTGNPIVIQTAGIHCPAEGIIITSLPSYHDEVNGQKRGPNLIHIIEAAGLRLVHLGDLGHELSPEQLKAIGDVDILFLPVGGYYTIDAQDALSVMEALQPRVTIPMHYQTEACLEMPIRPVADFLALAGVSPQPLPFARITDQDISQRPSVLVMTTPEGY